LRKIMPMLLETSKVVRHFGGVTALAGVDLELMQGEILGLIGPNGSGKTTLVNCISGVLPVHGGDIWLKGTTITRQRRQRRAYAGLARTFQTPRLFTELSVRENVSVGLNAARGRERGEVEPLLARLRLTDVAREAVSGLSYGYQRRVEIARALAGSPSILLLDEPAAGLNDVETEELRGLLLEIREEEGCAIIVIDHDMNLIINISDRVQVLDDGNVIFVGHPADVFKQAHVVEAYLGAD
jgi:ABC-type branched-subunit amino acid transport system ATPase component